MWDELGISGGTAIIILITLYFVVKWAVKNGVEEAYRNITGKQTFEEEEEDRMIEQWDKQEQKKKKVRDKKTKNRG